MGQVCAKHSEFYELECRWCEKKAEGPPAAPAAPPAATGWHMTAAQLNATAANAAPMVWGFIPHDYDGKGACKLCGHVFTHNGQPSCPAVLP